MTRQNRHFRDKNVQEISSEILQKYPFKVKWNTIGAGDGSRPYPKRDYQRQFWMSDWDYLNLLWQEWGICFYWENDTLVLMDAHGYPAQDEPYKVVRYLERDGQRIDEEHIHKLKYARGLTTGRVTVMDYDYTMSDVNRYWRKVGRPSETANDNAEEYIWADYAQPQQGAMGLNAKRNDEEFEGSHLARVRADAHRNKSLVIKATGNLRGVRTGRQLTITGHPFEPVNRKYIVTGIKLDIVNNDSVTQSGENPREFKCRIQFTGVPSGTYFRIPLKAKKPRAFAETAVVVGFENDPTVLTDPMARVRVKFNWDRLSKLDEEASCWVSQMQNWQGKRYGGMWIPRVGDHVYIGYVNSDPDRPFILGGHVTDYNEVPWDLCHNHALSGWRSSSLEGFGKGSNMVVTDDTPGKLQVQIASDHAQSRVAAGSITGIVGDKGRTDARGEGIEVATEAHVVARGNRGVLVTSETRAGVTAPVKDMGETVQRLTNARQQHEDMAQLAAQHKAQARDYSQRDVTYNIKAQNDAIKGSAKTVDNPSPEMTRPDVVVASAAGIATTATDSTHVASVNDHAVTAGRDVSLSSGRSLFASVRGAISMFAYALGMKLIAAKGKVEIQAQSDEMTLDALKNLTVRSVNGNLILTAKGEVFIGAGGSYIRISAAGITNGSPGPILEKTPFWDAPAASSERVPLPPMPIAPLAQNPGELFSQTFDASAVAENQGGGVVIADQPYRIYLPDGTVKQQGVLTEGATLTVTTPESVKVKLEIGAGDWSVIEDSYDEEELLADDEQHDDLDDDRHA
ncbi:type VI secretion system Vgr family protein [Paraburkholderia tropica]|uniref:type VI secretion system Vgr family protein n=1 Tax=Paraburkholderia tropica TaxID=92647 RepID=UPI002AB61DB0|nr:type VI secretion system tip protein TssI/VgrG [Paraburkholderia tropica]